MRKAAREDFDEKKGGGNLVNALLGTLKSGEASATTRRRRAD